MTGYTINKCPKCSHTITSETECGNCGIVFEKYFQAEAKRKVEPEQITIVIKESGNKGLILIVSVLFIIAVGAAVFFERRSRVSSAPVVSASPVADVQNDMVLEKVPENPPPPLLNQPVDKSVPEGEYIQKALSGTVSVKTAWGGIGSGFFIDNHSVITNKHVVTFDDSRFENFRNRTETNRRLIDLETEKLNNLKRKMRDMPDGPAREQVRIIIERNEAEINQALNYQKNNEENLDKINSQKSSSSVKVVMADGREYRVESISKSSTHDLALLKVYSVSGQVLDHGSTDQLQPGQKVYAIGSPMGLNSTVTSGIFSAYRKIAGKDTTYLQFDAAINPGNSGGPLIDSQGNVIGVNTLLLNNAGGIGFAIPIDVVLKDFGY